MPDVPVAALAKNAPATVPPAPLIENEVLDVLITDGSAVVAVPNVAAFLFPL
jgi:hypothetical protein